MPKSIVPGPAHRTTPYAVTMRAMSTIRPYDANPRVNDPAVDAVAASIREFGWRQPIVVDAAGVIIVGHTRYKAALKLGLTKVPVHVAADLSPTQARAYRIADNRTGDTAEWDIPLLGDELKGLQDAEFDLSLLGFEEKELTELLSAEEKRHKDSIGQTEAPPEQWAVLIQCEGERAQLALIQEMTKRGLKCKAYIL